MAITAGVHGANVANKWLDALCRNTNAVSVTQGLFVKLHTGNPGLSCTASASTVTTRVQATFGSAATQTGTTASIAANGTLPSWTSWAGSNETITHISLWDSSGAAAGNPVWSGALTTSKAVSAGDTFSLSSLTLSITGLATDT